MNKSSQTAQQALSVLEKTASNLASFDDLDEIATHISTASESYMVISERIRSVKAMINQLPVDEDMLSNIKHLEEADYLEQGYPEERF